VPELAIRNIAMLDRLGSFDGPFDIIVRDGSIEDVGRGLAVPPGAAVLEGDGLFLMPGAFDCHSHLTISSLDMSGLLDQPLSRWALEAAVNTRRTLEAGITFVRDAAGADAGIRDAIRDGVIPGPETQISIVLVAQTGGHGDGFLSGPGLEMASQYILPDYPGRPPFLVDGVDAMRHVVRTILRAGADWIKLATTGGVLSPHDDPLGAELTLEEITTAVFEAGRKGRAVMVHAFGGEGVDNAIAAGVRSIEHGIFLTEEQAARMAEAGCWLVPTLAVMEDVFALARSGALPPALARKALEVESLQGKAVEIARAAGVRIALGTDSFTRQAHGRNLREITLMRRAGLSPAEALLAATTGGAELCAVAERLGSLEPGRRFDAILLDEDPSDTLVFERPEAVTGVFKAGVPVVRHPRLGA
jgi:imidazolonepropionase-like amidohydrolase